MEYDCYKADRLGKKARIVGFFCPLPRCGRSDHAIEGKIHSLESLGLVDGPGIRAVVFMQGCRLRCRYCHNPDTWALTGGETIAPAALVEQLKRFLPYYVRERRRRHLLRRGTFVAAGIPCGSAASMQGSGHFHLPGYRGVGYGEYADILRYTDLVLYDVKHYTPEGYLEITGQPMTENPSLCGRCAQRDVPMWVRHVVVPGITDSEAHLRGLARYVRTLPRVERVELLGYHLLGWRNTIPWGLPIPWRGYLPYQKSGGAPVSS